MKRVTRDIELKAAADLRARVPRACLAYAAGDGLANLPVKVIWHDERTLVALPADMELPPHNNQEAVLLIDEGIYYFQLRAIYLRGSLQIVESPAGETGNYSWYELIPSRVAAWDYGKMRLVNDGP